MPSIVSSGNRYVVYGNDVSLYDSLPPKTFKVEFSEMSGYSLVETDELARGSEKTYGSLDARVNKSVKAYFDSDRSLGILATGPKGMGKSMLLRGLAAAMRDHNLATVVVSNDTPELADFLDTLGECVIVFDEFEKNFGAKDRDPQVQFLGLFDGMSSVKRMYVVTANTVQKLNEHLVGRPGRFHYHFNFLYPTDEEITEYLTDNNISEDQISKVLVYSKRVNLNYDHLRAIVKELAYGEFDKIIGDLNIIGGGPELYTVSFCYETRNITGTSLVDLSSDTARVEINSENSSYSAYIMTNLLMADDQGLFVDRDGIVDAWTSSDLGGTPIMVHLTPYRKPAR